MLYGVLVCVCVMIARNDSEPAWDANGSRVEVHEPESARAYAEEVVQKGAVDGPLQAECPVHTGVGGPADANAPIRPCTSISLFSMPIP